MMNNMALSLTATMSVLGKSPNGYYSSSEYAGWIKIKGVMEPSSESGQDDLDNHAGQMNPTPMMPTPVLD